MRGYEGSIKVMIAVILSVTCLFSASFCHILYSCLTLCYEMSAIDFVAGCLGGKEKYCRFWSVMSCAGHYSS